MPSKAGNISAERNRNKRRDKKLSRRKSGMRVDDSAKTLAEIRYQRYKKLYPDLESMPVDPYNGRSRPD